MNLIALLVAVVLLSFLSLWINSVAANELEGLLQLVFAPIVALVGAATGFYYGARPKS